MSVFKRRRLSQFPQAECNSSRNCQRQDALNLNIFSSGLLSMLFGHNGENSIKHNSKWISASRQSGWAAWAQWQGFVGADRLIGA
jgi:hypothetical protein